MRRTEALALVLASLGTGCATTSARTIRDTIPLSASVVRVRCGDVERGSGFVHASGKVVTSAHVLAGCPGDQVTIKVGGAALAAPPAATDPRLDLALLAPAQKVDGGLRVWAGDDLVIGEPVVAWGYPAGYDGAAPLLTAGYLSGVGAETTGPVSVPRGLVNGAFNLGNSGGPLIDVRTLTVVGVVASKLAPVPRDVETALSALAAQKGLGFTARTADGKELQVSEAQVVARVLQYLRQQTQLAIGLVVLPTDLKSFLRANAVTP